MPSFFQHQMRFIIYKIYPLDAHGSEWTAAVARPLRPVGGLLRVHTLLPVHIENIILSLNSNTVMYYNMPEVVCVTRGAVR